jgi:segregation and condensation protein A
MTYTIDLPAFAGPLDLLLHLIERQELDITAISLVTVTEQYLGQVRQMQEEQMAHLIDFLVVGARLAQIKSRALLPQTPVIILDEAEEEDPAEALVRQLRQYKRFKELALWLADREEAGYRTYLRLVAPPRLEKRLDLTGVTTAGLLTAVQEALAHAEQVAESVAIVRPRRLTIEQQIGRLRQRLKQSSSFLFTDLLSAKRDRVEVAITLLAVLELVKQQELTAHQPELFGPIELRTVNREQ